MIDLGRAKQIDGWMSDSELEFLARVARDSNITVEFGSYKGRSTRAMADNTKGIIYAVDPWDGKYFRDDGSFAHLFSPDNFSSFFANLSDHIRTRRVIPYCAHSRDFRISDPVDFVFIDGDHRYNSVISDIQIAQQLVKKGVIAGHDYTHTDWPGVKRAVDELLPDKFKLVDSIWWYEV
jgi:predicted O-methyltransferase YrrM